MQIAFLSKKKGIAKLKISRPEDLLTLKRIIKAGDVVEALTLRKVKKTPEQQEKFKKLVLRIRVSKVKLYSNRLRLLGEILWSSKEDAVPLKSYHSIDLKLGSQLKIFKTWKEYEIQQIMKARERCPNILLCAFDFGEASFAMLGPSGIQPIGEISVHKPPKDSKEYESLRKKFFKGLAEKLIEMFERKKPDAIICGSQKVFLEVLKEYLPPEFTSKVLLGEISTSGIAGINEIIKRGYVELLVGKSRIAEEVKLVQDFMVHLARGEKCAKGFEEVKRALEYGAVQYLLISEKLLDEKLEEVEPILENAERTGAKVYLISLKHEAGEMLYSIGGIGAILRFDVK
ncbi:MAG: mRNA surveillance protein pelota [Candidatus Nanoarchaeia archaeon]|nr:mRNA surveillance protein pelota [Candidatus Haiyanarchaeum thermophilum]MCW1303028.1 mRNA surveillance protein pelota [Candidatus Haiyanarchaeum thermophilum]MCW1303706.1 mRNA surveillance protein pelota [Candidatus Haiyanarchaeum thermophilum]MCW1306386.1 mRNA surveillance protein pelota [Candidatus Haiyanarchaeum thermophilum]MCW1307104.1 mRNA surveillance protein pelota [Candidatus Haiyanarchaeum thermophilum]